MRRAILLSLALLTALVVVPSPAQATEPLIPASLPVLGTELDRGTGTRARWDPIAPAASRAADGLIGDWVGEASRYGGTAVYSGGEYVYQDYLFDPWGADDGADVELNATLEPLASAVPETYRTEGIFRYLAGELGAPPPFERQTNYGDLGPYFPADLEEVRVSTQGADLWLLARTTTLTSGDQTGLLALIDSAPGSNAHDAGFSSKLESQFAEKAVFVAGNRAWVRDLASGSVTQLPAGSAATNPAGYTNAIEARVPLSALGLADGASQVKIAVASGPQNAAGTGFKESGLPSNVANVAFRFDEPVREWMERRQAFALYERQVDVFFAKVSLDRIRAGATERFLPGPGYHERILDSAPEISRESDRNGIWQPYGLYVPKDYRRGVPAPLQYWLHWRGGTAHSAGTATPRIFQDLGDAFGTIVVSPRGRGTSSWYVGTAQVDFQEVWDDVHSELAIDQNRTYLAGHSMGGYGSFLFSVLYPDRFAAALPASPPATQGAWTGVKDFDRCDEFTFDEFSPCYIEANGGRAADQHYKRMLGNLRNVPIAIFTGAADELVPYSGVLRHHIDLMKKWKYRHRLYTFLTQEHYGPPVWDQWHHGGLYMHKFVRDPNPPRVTYRRDMPFERAVEELNTNGAPLSFDLAPASPGQTGPYLMTGMKWVNDPTASAPPAANAFQASLEDAVAVKLHLERMAITTSKKITGTVSTNRALELRLVAPWGGLPNVSSSAGDLGATVSGDVLVLHLPPGSTTFTIG
ncbi:MAG: esterase family protein [Actinobacteria bacterium]|nr:esterase family protein [Actinomycetota bacterium]